MWEAKSEQAADSQTVTFTTTLPDAGVKLTKTFTLKKGEYHLGLSVKIERLAGAKDPKPFRYQLDGETAHLRGNPPRGGENIPTFNLHYEITIRK